MEEFLQRMSQDPCRSIGAHLTCSQFVQYDSRAHELQTLASFSFWVQSMLPAGRYPLRPCPDCVQIRRPTSASPAPRRPFY